MCSRRAQARKAVALAICWRALRLHGGNLVSQIPHPSVAIDGSPLRGASRPSLSRRTRGNETET
eukprot:8055354-Pyramimonas_sp.AAC.2